MLNDIVLQSYPVLLDEAFQQSPHELSRLPVQHVDVFCTLLRLLLAVPQYIGLVGIGSEKQNKNMKLTVNGS